MTSHVLLPHAAEKADATTSLAGNVAPHVTFTSESPGTQPRFSLSKKIVLTSELVSVSATICGVGLALLLRAMWE